MTGVAFSGDGSRLAAARGSQTVVWDVRTGSVVFQRTQEEPVQSVAFSADGRHVAGGDVAGVTRVWNLRTGDAVEVRGHEGTIASLALQPGRRVAGHGERGRDGGDLGCARRDVDRRAPRP